ncbi:MAG: amino acid ABC transporter substrate-binding protein [Polaromonas sp.]|nr:amino acid ABC transporter substrate-binding protein [Polaromonas sp.]
MLCSVCTLSFAQALPTDRLQRVESQKVLRVCIWPDYYGISFRNPKTQQLSGIDIDNAQDLARDLGVAVQFVDSSFARFMDDLEADRCDLAMFAIGITPARQARLRFTQPHLASDIYAITTQSNRRIRSWADIDQPGVVVAVAKGTLHEAVMKTRLKAAELSVVNTPAAREQDVQSGRADVFMTDYPFSRRMLDNSDWARLVSPPEQFHITPYAWAMVPGDDRFFDRIDKALADMKRDGRLLRNAKKHGLEPIAVLQTKQP